jgi:hypothetical protein
MHKQPVQTDRATRQAVFRVVVVDQARIAHRFVNTFD